MLMSKSKRQTGRTSKTIAAAIALAKKEKCVVYIVAATSCDALRIQDEIPTNYSNTVKTTMVDRFDFDRGSSIGAHFSCKFIVDHFTIENEISKKLDEIRKLQTFAARYNIDIDSPAGFLH